MSVQINYSPTKAESDIRGLERQLPPAKIIAQWVEAERLGLKSETNNISPCAISLKPWQLSQNQFKDAVNTASSLSRLFNKVAQDKAFLINSLADFNDPLSLINALKTSLVSEQTQAINLNLSRQDLLLDNKGNWRLVESNSIAAGMGPFSEALINIQSKLSLNHALEFAPNPATRKLAKAMYSAAKEVSGCRTPNIVFVVDNDEDNIYDHQRVANELNRFGAKVFRRSFKELSVQLSSKNERLQLQNKNLVDCLYFRSGYNLDDYVLKSGSSTSSDKDSKSHSFRKLIELRQWIEKHQVVVAPSIAFQLSTSKWVQMKLARFSANQLKTQFKLTPGQAKLAQSSLASGYVIAKNHAQICSKLATNNWILKTQNEGGGNVFNRCSNLPPFDFEKDQLILMEKIESVARKDILSLTRNKIKQYELVISELGIFTLGEQGQYGGYLLRSKPNEQLETGVHKAGGFLDCLAIN